MGVHCQPDIIERALGKGVYLFFLPRNTSHITQLLDEAPSGVFQRLVATGAQQGVIDGMLGDEGARNALLEAAYAAGSRAFLPNIIIGAFCRCGLWPFDPERMLSQVADALGLGHTDDRTRGVSSPAAADVIHGRRKSQWRQPHAWPTCVGCAPHVRTAEGRGGLGAVAGVFECAPGVPTPWRPPRSSRGI